MEHYANSVEDHLIDGLKYKLEPGASYVQSRRQVTWYPSGSAIYSPTSGTRLIRVNINSTGEWLDPQSVRFSFKLNNTDGSHSHLLRTICEPFAFFTRLRCLIGNVVAEDIVDYGRTHSLFQTLTSSNNRRNDEIEGFGHRWTDIVPPITADNTYGIGGGKSKRVTFKLLSGLFSQWKYIPLQFCPIVLELELDQDQYANIVQPDGNIFTTDNTSTSFTIDDVVVHGDVVTLDNSLNNSYIEALMSGTALSVPFTTFVSQSHIMSQTQQFNVNIIRSFTRLKTMFISFYAPVPDKTIASTEDEKRLLGYRDYKFNQRGGVNIAGSGDTTISAVLRPCNRFYHPMGIDTLDPYSSSAELQWQISIGSLTFPVYPCRSTAETFYRLKQSLGILPSSFHALDISYVQYKDTHFIIGVDLEKVTDAAWTGLNTKAGDLVSVKTTWDPSIATNSLPFKMYVVMTADYLLEIRDSGCQIFD